MTRYFLFGSLLVFAGCASQIKNLSAPGEVNTCLSTAAPTFKTELYSASVDVYGNHISGLMFFKTMPDSSKNVVFTTETGLTFFNFSWSKSGEFKVHHILEKLDKKVVINLLRKDLEFMLIPSAYKSRAQQAFDKTYSVALKKETVFFSISPDCRSLEKAEVRHGNSIKTKVSYFPANKNVPDSVTIKHLNFTMQLSLSRIDRNHASQ